MLIGQVSLEMVKMYLDECTSGVPWETLNYMVSEISYGGRVTDTWDRRCITSIVSEYFNSDALSPRFKLSASELYHGLDREMSVLTVQTHVEQFPYDDSPVVFGMHPNANIAFLMQESAYLSQNISTIQASGGSSASSGGATNNVANQATALLEALPDLLVASEGLQTQNDSGALDAMAIVLGHEVARFNRLLVVIRCTLKELLRAIKGEVIMSDELDAVSQALLFDQVPPPFTKAAYPSLKPFGSWMADLNSRIDFVRLWLHEGAPNCFWISGFYFPQGFMTSVLQSHARKYAIAIDTLSFAFSVTTIGREEVSEAPEDGVLCHGMFMDGARFDWEASLVADSLPGTMYYSMPVIQFIPTPNYKPNTKDYLAPLYKTSLRAGTLSTTGHSTNFVVAISLPSNKEANYWILRGAALLCQLDT